MWRYKVQILPYAVINILIYYLFIYVDLKSDILFYVFHIVCGIHYDNVRRRPSGNLPDRLEGTHMSICSREPPGAICVNSPKVMLV